MQTEVYNLKKKSRSLNRKQKSYSKCKSSIYNFFDEGLRERYGTESARICPEFQKR